MFMTSVVKEWGSAQVLSKSGICTSVVKEWDLHKCCQRVEICTSVVKEWGSAQVLSKSGDLHINRCVASFGDFKRSNAFVFLVL